jgi:hypothetical protein
MEERGSGELGGQLWHLNDQSDEIHNNTTQILLLVRQQYPRSCSDDVFRYLHLALKRTAFENILYIILQEITLVVLYIILKVITLVVFYIILQEITLVVLYIIPQEITLVVLYIILQEITLVVFS